VRTRPGCGFIPRVSIEMQTGLTDGWNPPWARILHWPILAAFFASVLADLWAISANFESPWALGTLHWQPWLWGAFSLGIGLARQLPLQSVILAAAGSFVFTLGIGFISLWVSSASEVAGLGFGKLALVWLMLALASLGTARTVLSRFRKSDHFGSGVLALASLLMVMLLKRTEDLHGAHRVFGENVRSGPASVGSNLGPIGNLILGTLVFAHLVLMMQLLRNKRPAQMRRDMTPIVVLCAVFVWLEAANWISL
jgi:hypothetical protein